MTGTEGQSERAKLARKKYYFSYEVSGNYALFTQPESKTGIDKVSYVFPTAAALSGLTESIYWKPTFLVFIDKVKVMNEIQTTSPIGTAARIMSRVGVVGADSLDISSTVMLKNVRYRVLAHISWNMSTDEYKNDRNVGKHLGIMNRRIATGGTGRATYLGTSECCANILPYSWSNEPEGFYAGSGSIKMDGNMFLRFKYPEETGRNELVSLRWMNPHMNDGIIDFSASNMVISQRFIRNQNIYNFRAKRQAA